VVSVPEPKPVQRPVLKLVPRSTIASPSTPPAEDKGSNNVIDPATELFSKQQFEAMFSKSFKQCQRFKQQMSCMLIDLDGTKMERNADQELIRAIVSLVQTTIREVDTAAWWTGESLIVLLPNTHRNDAVQAAARVLEAVANHPFTWPDATRVTMSIGVAGLPDSNIDSEKKLIDAAALASKHALDMMVTVPKSLDGLIRNRKESINTTAVGEEKK
jgi:diguanylate cyclase (GGDEF)-like protein